MVWGALIGAAGSLAGGLLSQSGAKDANKANERIAQDNRDFQERMSNTAHQRQMVDLHKAGLNPILSAKYGGSSTPAGNIATMQNENAQLGESVSNAAQKGMQAQNTMANTELQKQQALLTQNNASIKGVDAEIKRLQLQGIKAAEDELGKEGITVDSVVKKGADIIRQGKDAVNSYDNNQVMSKLSKSITEMTDSQLKKVYDFYNENTDKYAKEINAVYDEFKKRAKHYTTNPKYR